MGQPLLPTYEKLFNQPSNTLTENYEAKRIEEESLK
jgi:hypothetical protein